MENQKEEGLSLAKVVLPSGILEYFTLSNIVQTKETLDQSEKYLNILNITDPGGNSAPVESFDINPGLF